MRTQDVPFDGGFVRYYGPTPPEDWRSKAILTRAGSSEWTLDIATRTGYDGQGHGEALIETIREWAAEHGWTVYADNVGWDVRGFYERIRCAWLADRQQYLVAPVGACH